MTPPETMSRRLLIVLPILVFAACTPTQPAAIDRPVDAADAFVATAASGTSPSPADPAPPSTVPDGAADISPIDRYPAPLRFPYLAKPRDSATARGANDASNASDMSGTSGTSDTTDAAPNGDTAVTSPCAGILQRDGDRFVLDGQPVFLFGLNATMLMDREVKEDQIEPLVAALGERGVNTIRVWFFEDEDPDRFARLLDSGARHGVRFVVTLADNVFKGRDWFGGKEDEKRYRPHLARTVERFKDRPEVAAWELINEPNCAGNPTQECLDTIKGWLRARAAEVKAIDACHLVSTGMIGAGNYDEDLTMYRRVHREPVIDIVSAHRRSSDESEKERAAAEELDRPLLYGEIYDEGYDDGCNPLSDDALSRRAERIADDVRDAIHNGVDGYLLWDFAPGTIRRTGGKTKDYCNKFGYGLDDPLWAALKERAGLVPAAPWHGAGVGR
ncbi:MAG: hypothetical protein ABI780_12240 [Ardenticatenales bacterium]